jgi:hypothetical protein
VVTFGELRSLNPQDWLDAGEEWLHVAEAALAVAHEVHDQVAAPLASAWPDPVGRSAASKIDPTSNAVLFASLECRAAAYVCRGLGHCGSTRIGRTAVMSLPDSSTPSETSDEPRTPPSPSAWAVVAVAAAVVGLALATAAGVWVRLVVHREADVCAPNSAVPQHVPGGLFPLYWTGVAGLGVSAVASVLAARAAVRTSTSNHPRSGRRGYGIAAVALLLAAVASTAVVRSLPAALLLAGGALACLVAVVRAGSPDAVTSRPALAVSRGPWWVTAVVTVLIGLALAVQVPHLHYTIRDSRELCRGGFG